MVIIKPALLMPNIAVFAANATREIQPGDSANSSAKTAFHRGILLIEPDISLLSAETLLLTQSNYCVTPAFSQSEVFILRDTKAVALAIISDSLGRRLLGAVAETVRRQWPRARILVLGRAAMMLEDHLYDEQIEHSTVPRQLLDDLERLYKDSWNERSNTLDWNGSRSKNLSGLRDRPDQGSTSRSTIERTLWDMPSLINYRPR